MTLVLSPEPLAAQLAGPAIRATELARAIGGEVAFSHPHAPSDLKERAAAAGVVVAHPAWPLTARALRRSGARLIYDLYDPEPFEALQFLAGRRAGVRRTVTAMSLDRLVNALHDGHAFLCASERQRDLWTGTLLSQRLIAPAVHDEDPTLGGLLAVVPFGVPDESPVPGDGPRERFALDPQDEIVLWNGGVWDWLDPESVLHAVARLSPDRPRLRLVFMGASTVAHARGAEQRARALARDLGLLGRVVRFNDGWVPYAQRGAWLLQADCAIAAHHDHLETRFSHRTRLLDCIWAGLPVVCTRGDELAERVEREELGAAVSPEDPTELAAALARVLDRGRTAYADRLAAAAADLRWSRVAAPLDRLSAERAGSSEPLGARAGRRRPRAPGLRGRDAMYRTARSLLNSVGRRDWPRVR
jgi:glycosyltransferase involved in cell wall biosynthesis